MLRHQIGEDAFTAHQHYLEVNGGKNVVTSDLTKAIEELRTPTSTILQPMLYVLARRNSIELFLRQRKTPSDARRQTDTKNRGRVVSSAFRRSRNHHGVGPKLYDITVSKDIRLSHCLRSLLR